MNNLDNGVCLGTELSSENLGAVPSLEGASQKSRTWYSRNNPSHGSKQGRVVGRDGKDAGDQTLLSGSVGGHAGTSRIQGRNDGDDHVAKRQQRRADDEDLSAVDLVDKEQGYEASDGANRTVQTADEELAVLVELESGVDGSLVVLHKGDAGQHGGGPDEGADKQTLPEGGGLDEIAPRKTALRLELLGNVDLDDGKLGAAPLVVGPVEVVAAEGLLGLLVAALEAEPAGRLAEEEDSDAEDESWDTLDGEAETPLVGVVPFALANAGPEGDKEAQSDH